MGAMGNPEVVLVDEYDRPIGSSEKMDAHRRGLLHRAFSVFVFDGDKILVQRRALCKYHCAGLWSNSCCSHPEPGEALHDAVLRRLEFELGLDDSRVTGLEEVDVLLYRTEFPNGLIEHECDHILVCSYHGKTALNENEVAEVKWLTFDQLSNAMSLQPEKYTYWFKQCIERMGNCLMSAQRRLSEER